MEGTRGAGLAFGLGAVGLFLWWRYRQGAASSDPAGDTPSPGTEGDDASPVSGDNSAMPGNAGRYAPGSPEMLTLFGQAATQAGVPASWASADSLTSLLASESAGWVGIPNYQFGALSSPKQIAAWPSVWTAVQNGTWRSLIDASKYPPGSQSSATGLGQLTATNIPKYYPSGLQGIGVPLEEAIGMLKYIADRYPNGPDQAWAFHQANNWY